MKSIFKHFIILALVVPAAHAQTGGFSWQDAADGQSAPDGIGGSAQGDVPSGGLTTYTDLSAFQAAAPGAVNSEDFEDNVGIKGPTSCPEPVNSSSNGPCFTPGQIVDGLQITSSDAGGVILLPPGFNGIADHIAGANSFSATTLVEFTSGNTEAVGMNVYAGLASGDVTLTVRGTGGGMIGSTTVTGLGPLPDNQFIGVVADQVIGEIELAASGENGELFDNVLFGPAGGQQLPEAPAIPALSPAGLVVLALALAALSAVVLVKRRSG